MGLSLGQPGRLGPTDATDFRHGLSHLQLAHTTR